jgi:hypothetical protein
MKKRINKITFYTVGLCYIAVIVIGFIFVGSEVQAKNSDTKPIVAEAVFYDVPIDIDLLDHIQG